MDSGTGIRRTKEPTAKWRAQCHAPKQRFATTDMAARHWSMSSEVPGKTSAVEVDLFTGLGI